MPRRLAAAALVVASSASIPMVLAPAACTPSGECSPEKFDLEAATRVSPGFLVQASGQPCAQSGVTIVSDNAALAELWARLGDAGIDAGPGPVVDFAAERVVVVDHLSTAGVSWTVVRGDKVIVGLLGCTTTIAPDPASGCTTDVYRLGATVLSAETRTCAPVACSVTQAPL